MWEEKTLNVGGNDFECGVNDFEAELNCRCVADEDDGW